MLHEILLYLSGHASPLLSTAASKGDEQYSRQGFSTLSPPEKALLASLAHLGDLNSRLQSRTSLISSSHPSTICRTVSTTIASVHLLSFQRKILEVEASILKKDSGIVGGYGIVPLSRIVDEFDEWTRRMEWFWDMVQFMAPDEPQSEVPTDSNPGGRGRKFSGAALINKLRSEVQTGYPDLEEAALSLIKAAETAWLRQLSAWVLYGQLPTFGEQDFLISPGKSNDGESSFVIRHDLIPEFVTTSASSSILFIGRSLNQIRARSTALTRSSKISSSSPELALLPAHLHHLSLLSSPITKSSLSSAIAAIRLSLSQNSLQHLLPLNKILETLRILKSFFLLDHGEFAVALVSEADKRIQSRHQRATASQGQSIGDDLGSVIMKEGEISATLTGTWAALSAFQAHEDDADEQLDLARELLNLSTSQSVDTSPKPRDATAGQNEKIAISEVTFNTLLFGTPAYLTIHVSSPLDLFLTSTDLNIYSHIHSYLISLRRAHLHLTGLWRLTSLRRDHPAPLGPPLSNTRNGEAALAKKRRRALDRAKSMRFIWATAGAAVFFLAEVEGYFQGEVITSSWDNLQSWLDPPTSAKQQRDSDTSRPTTSASAQVVGLDQWDSDAITSRNNSRQSPQLTAAANPSTSTPPDPETLSKAHKRYLAGLTHFLLLTDTSFTRILRSFLSQIDHFVALITRLHFVRQNMDLETDEGVVDTFVDYTSEEKELVADLSNARKEVDEGIKSIVTRLRDIDSERVGQGNQIPGEGRAEERGFVPWNGNGVDRLLMKLDFTSFGMNDDGFDDD